MDDEAKVSAMPVEAAGPPDSSSGPPPVSAGQPQGADASRLGKLAGRYVLRKRLSAGPCGVVFRAHDEREDREVAVRVLAAPLLKAVDPEALERRAARMSEVSGRGVARVWGLEADGTSRFLVTEYVSGQRLSDLVAAKRTAGKPFTAQGAYNIAGHVLWALQTAHSAGVHHGDLRPENVFIDAKGRVKVADLGVGELLTPLRRTLGGASPYDPPETRADKRSDLRAAMLIFAELYTGRPPIEAVRALPEAVSALVRPWLAESPEERPGHDATELRDLLQRALQEVTRQARDEAREKAESERRKTSLPPPLPRSDSQAIDDLRRESQVMLRKVIDKVGAARDQGAELWLAHRDGLDFGPFSTDELIQRVRDQEFDDETTVQDLATGIRQPLRAFPDFEKPLGRLLAERKARAQVQAAEHTARVKTVKKAGKGVFVFGTIGGLAVVGGLVWVLAHKPLPKPIAFAEVARTVGRSFDPPVLEPAEAVAERLYKEERKRRKKARVRAMRAADQKVVDGYSGDAPAPAVTSLDMSDDDSGDAAKFSQAAVDKVLARANGSIQGCLRKELKRNPKLGSVRLAFWVTPSGRTKGAGVQGKSTVLFGKCMVGVVESLKFPAFSGAQRKVSVPFEVSR